MKHLIASLLLAALPVLGQSVPATTYDGSSRAPLPSVETYYTTISPALPSDGGVLIICARGDLTKCTLPEGRTLDDVAAYIADLQRRYDEVSANRDQIYDAFRKELDAHERDLCEIDKILTSRKTTASPKKDMPCGYITGDADWYFSDQDQPSKKEKSK